MIHQNQNLLFIFTYANINYDVCESILFYVIPCTNVDVCELYSQIEDFAY